MKKSELEKIYKKVAKEIDFKEDPVHKGWMPKLGPNDYKCKIVHGTTEKGPVTLTVGPKEAVDTEESKLAGDYFLAKKKPNPSIVLTKVWSLGSYDDYSWVVRKRVDGANPLFFGLHPLWDDKRKIAELYWKTIKVFSGLETKNGPKSNVEDFLRERLDKWKNLAKAVNSKNIDKRSHEKINLYSSLAVDFFRYVAYETNILESAGLEMELFFRHFGNTDIVIQGGKYYLPSPEITFFPQFYGAAYFVWNVLIHEPLFTADEVEEWHLAFRSSCPGKEGTSDKEKLKENFGKAFRILLLERVFGTLLADIPCGRSPFNKNGRMDKTKAKKAEKLFVTILKHLLEELPSLAKNDPFGEGIEKLNKLKF